MEQAPQKVVIAKEVSEHDLAREQQMFKSSLFKTPDGKWLHICTIITASRSGIAMIYENWGNAPYCVITNPELVGAIERAIPLTEPREEKEDEG